MEEIMNKMCLKRLCLPSNININDLRNGTIKQSIYNKCHCSNHIACTFNDSNNEILTYGINMYYNSNDDKTVHAEVSSILNLQPLHSPKKNLKKINILVIKTTHTGKIGSSQPCIYCINTMMTLPQKRGYIIKKIYYSNMNGDIIQTTLKNLAESNDFHIPKYYR